MKNLKLILNNIEKARGIQPSNSESTKLTLRLIVDTEVEINLPNSSFEAAEISLASIIEDLKIRLKNQAVPEEEFNIRKLEQYSVDLNNLEKILNPLCKYKR